MYTKLHHDFCDAMYHVCSHLLLAMGPLREVISASTAPSQSSSEGSGHVLSKESIAINDQNKRKRHICADNIRSVVMADFGKKQLH